VPLHHNVFSYFPTAMEMHYLLAMQLRHGPWAGAYLAQLMHVSVCALSVLAVYAAARTFAEKPPAILAAIAMANVPWVWLLAPVGYNEGALILFTTLALAWLFCRGDACVAGGAAANSSTLRVDRDAGIAPTRRNHWLLAGVMAGFACGVKLTAVPQVLMMLPIIAAFVAIARGEPIRRVLANAAVFILAGSIVFSPWLIRNAIWARNPVFPEAQNLLGHAHFSQTQTQRWHRAHSPPPNLQPITARLREAWHQIAADWRFGYELLPLGLLCALLSLRRPEARLLLLLLLAWLIFWLAFTHLQGRFFVLAIPIAAMSVALMQTRPRLIFVACVLLIQLALGSLMLINTFAYRVALLRDQGFLAFDDFKEFLPDDVKDLIVKGRPIALVGDARAFLYATPMSGLHYRTVFDVDVKPGESVVDAWVAGATGSPDVVIDPIELDRFSRTYLGIPPLPDDFPGPRDHPFIAMPQHPPATR